MKHTMIVSHLLKGFLAVSAAVVEARHKPRDYASKDYHVLELDSSVSQYLIATRLGLSYEGDLGVLDSHYIFSDAREGNEIVKMALQGFATKKGDVDEKGLLEGILFIQKQLPRKPWEKRIPSPPPSSSDTDQVVEPLPSSRLLQRQRDIMNALGISDPIFQKQWHLFNTVQKGHDINVTGVWEEGISGLNITVAIVDDGLDMNSEDLGPNYYAEGSYDFNDHQNEPEPTNLDDHHGTRCAGEVAAARNNVCGIGIAYDSKVSGLRVLSKSVSDADEAAAITYDFQNNHIYSCSWGPLDNGRTMEAPDILVQRAMLKGIQEGRGGLGSIYVFATGNGAAHDDNCNFDGYANSVYTTTIGAIDRTDQHPYYSEPCSAQLAVTYSSGAGDAIYTTDVGKDNCFGGHSGTSAAAPIAAGVYSLVLSVRPDLYWRDLQWLQVVTAVPINVDDGGWQNTTLGKFSHTFGYGKIDAYSIVQTARRWRNRKPQAWYVSQWIHVNSEIPQDEGSSGLAIKHDVTIEAIQQANLERPEHVTVRINIDHTRRGDLSVDLISPAGVISCIATARKLDSTNAGYNDWNFMTVDHW